MSKLEELIARLCPDGVEYKELGEILKIKNGKDYKGRSKVGLSSFHPDNDFQHCSGKHCHKE